MSALTPVRRLPEHGLPWTRKRAYRNKSVPGWTKELNGDFEWTFKSDGNGVFELF